MHTFVTTTAYGSWLPGDARGWVAHGKILPPNPVLEHVARAGMTSPAVFFNTHDQIQLLDSIQSAAVEFHYHLQDLAIESWHLHWIVVHPDGVQRMIGRLKNRMRQALDRGRIWTAGYHARVLPDAPACDLGRRYIAQHPGCRILAGKLLPTR